MSSVPRRFYDSAFTTRPIPPPPLLPLAEMVARINWWRLVGFHVVRGLDARPERQERAS